MTDTRDNKGDAKALPITVILNKIQRIASSIQKNMELIFVIKGTLFVTVNNKQYKLNESDVILINNGDLYQVTGEEENLVLSVQIDYEFFKLAVKREESVYDCNSSVNNAKSYDHIRKTMSTIMYDYSNREQGYELKIMSMLYKLIYILNSSFLINETQEIQNLDIQNSKYNQRMNSIISYIKQNYYREISLQDVANSQYLTPEYLSKFFKNQMGMNFSRYLNEFRLSQALKELVRTDNSVTKIAMNNGFPNLVAFNKIFREVYNTTPAEYRNEIRKKQQVTNVEAADSQIIKVDYNEVFHELNKYVALEEEADAQPQKSSSVCSLNISVDINSERKVTHSWKNLINLGYASDGLRSDLQQHLTDIQSSITFKYARFQGIFSDEMLIDEGSMDSATTYNFNKIDKLIDFLYSIRLKPFIELGDKAKVLNLATDKFMYFKPSSSRQRGFKESLELLNKFIVHCANRYGIDEVSQWYFEIWKDGEKNHIFWDGTFIKYMNVFQSYYRIIKQIVPKAKVGGPGINPEVNSNLLGEMLNEWNKSGVIPDFLSLSLYSHELIEDSKSKSANKRHSSGKNSYKSEQDSYLPHMLLSTDRNYASFYLNNIREILKESKINVPELHVTEWNSTISHRQPVNDTIFKSAFIIKNVLDNLDETNSFGYWFCSDISGELKDSKALLYGEMGLISANGIRKPGFYAYEMLSKLGNKLIEKGNGYIVTSKSDYNYEVIAYNYKHFNSFYCLNEQSTISVNEVYSVFEDQQNLQLAIKLKGVKKGKYRIKKYILNRQHGSIFDEWLSMNAVYNLKKSEIDYLKQICIPKQTIFYLDSMDELIIEGNLQPHEVNLYEITFEYN